MHEAFLIQLFHRLAVVDMIFPGIISAFQQMLKFFQGRCLHQRFELIDTKAVVIRDRQRIYVGRKHMVILFRTVYPLYVEQIHVSTAVSCIYLQFLFVCQYLFSFFPYSRKVVQFQCQIIVKQSGGV